MANELVEQGQQREVAIAAPQGFSLTPRNLDEAFRLAEVLASSDLVPKNFQKKAGDVLVAVQWGHEVGLKPLQALQNIAVINGRPTLWGDAMLALVRSSPLCEYVVESFDAAGTAICQVKRRGEPEQSRMFSDADAKTAKLFGKEGPWQTAPRRMKQMRARAFALRDVFPDVLKGMAIAEEAMDLEPIEHSATPIDKLPGTAPAVPAELLEAAKTAAGGGRDAFAAWFKDKTNGGQTTKAEREQLVHVLGDMRAIAAEADKKTEEARAAAAQTPPAEGAAPATTGDPGVDTFLADLERAERADPQP